MIKKYLQRFPHAFRGLWHATTTDFGFRTQLYLGVVIAILIKVFFEGLTETEWLFVALSYTLIFITELQNSALESALDQVHPELHEHIKYSKDMAAAAVLIAGLFTNSSSGNLL